MEDLRLILPTIINKIKNTKKNGSILLRKHARDDQYYLILCRLWHGIMIIILLIIIMIITRYLFIMIIPNYYKYIYTITDIKVLFYRIMNY